MKFSGVVGFWGEEKEVSPGVWRPEIVERKYTGDVLKNYRSLQRMEKQNANLTTTNQISILSDLYAKQNWHSICYVIWNGVKWSVDNVEIDYPRLTLSLGGVYNGNEEETGGTARVSL